MRIFIIISFLFISGSILSQEIVADIKQQQLPEMRADKDFARKYRRQLQLLIRTYPMALKAKELIDEYNGDLSEIEKKRKKKKYGREAHRDLKEEFTYNILDLYHSEGDLLMKLVHRETGMTVREIVEKYKGNFSSDIYNAMGKMWDHDLNAKYDPKSTTSDDWVTEYVIQDIQAGRIDFDLEMHKMSKAEYKESMEEYKKGRKRTKKRMKENKKKQRNQKRQIKRDEKEKKD